MIKKMLIEANMNELLASGFRQNNGQLITSAIENGATNWVDAIKTITPDDIDWNKTDDTEMIQTNQFELLKPLIKCNRHESELKNICFGYDTASFLWNSIVNVPGLYALQLDHILIKKNVL